jgi:hypothetical protein
VKTSSCKAKGRRAAQEARDLLLKAAEAWLKPDDIKVTSSSVTGEDLSLSPKARDVYPYCLEVKCQERVNIWAALKQAQSHCEGKHWDPILAIRRNHTKLYAVLDFEHLAWLLCENYRLAEALRDAEM